MLLQHFARCEAYAMTLGETLEIGNHALGAQIVGVAQRPAAEGRKAEPEDRADVAVARIPDHTLAQRPRSLIHHAEQQALENLRRARSEEHTSELQSRRDLVCRLLLEKKKKKNHI